MEVKASLNNLRATPRKARQVVDLVRGKKVSEAKALLTFAIKKSSDPILKLLNSAVASATNNYKLDESNLYIAKITVDEGPKLKRWHPMSRGRAYPIIKRTSHINLILKEINPKEEVKKSDTEEKADKKVEKKEAKPKKKTSKVVKNKK